MSTLAFNPSPQDVGNILKTQLVKVYSSSGQFLDVWRDAPLLAGFKEAVNAATSPMKVKLPRAFDNYDGVHGSSTRFTVQQGNVVTYTLFGPGLSGVNNTGTLRYQGVIDEIVPEVDEQGTESVTVTLVPQSSVVADATLTGTQQFGTPGNSGTYIDAATMFNWFFITNNPLTGLPYMYPVTNDPGSYGPNSNQAQYTFQNQDIQSCFNVILTLFSSNTDFFWRATPNKTILLNTSNAEPQHSFNIGQHILTPSYNTSWMALKNFVQVLGASTQIVALTGSATQGTVYSALFVEPLPYPVVSGQQVVLNPGGSISQTLTSTGGNAQGATTLYVTSFTANANYGVNTGVGIPIYATAQGSSTDFTTYGARCLPAYSDPRITDQATAQYVANTLLQASDQMTLATKIRVADYRGDIFPGFGYDIESIHVGDLCQINNPMGLYQTALSNTAIITGLTYQWYYVDLELGALQPNQDVALQQITNRLQLASSI